MTLGMVSLRKRSVIKTMHLDVKLYLAQLGRTGLDEDLGRRSMKLASISSSLDSASDAIARVMLELAKRLDAQKLQFHLNVVKKSVTFRTVCKAMFNWP